MTPMFEIISVQQRNNRRINQEEVLHSYYPNGDLLIKTKIGKWFITNEGTFLPITWEEITDPRDFWPRSATVEEAIKCWEMEDITKKVEIDGAIEVWYDEGKN